MISIISLLLDIILSNYILKVSYFLPLFTLVSLIYLKKDKYYLFKCMSVGILYDLIFTEYIFLHITIYLILGYIILLFYKSFRYTYITNLIMTIIIITLYEFLLYIIFYILKIEILSTEYFIYIIKHYYLLNIIYTSILSIIYYIKHKLNTR